MAQSLVEAIRRDDNFETIKKLIRNGASVNIPANNVYPLDAAVNANNVKVVNYILKNGNVRCNLIRRIHENGDTLLHLVCKTKCPNIEIIRSLLKHGAKVNTANDYGETPLHVACMTADIKVVKLLINYDADVNFTDKNNGYEVSPICFATLSNSVDLVKLLLEHGADVLTVCRRKSVLHNLLDISQPDIAKLLIKHIANLSQSDELNWTDLSRAVFDCNTKSVKNLILTGHKVDMLSLYAAVACGNYNILYRIWRNIDASIVSNDLYFMTYVFDNWEITGSLNKLRILLNKKETDLHLERCGKAFSYFICRHGLDISERNTRREQARLIHRLVNRGLRLNPSDAEVIAHSAHQFGTSLFEIIINAALPKITKGTFCRSVDLGLGEHMIQYCLDVNPETIFSHQGILWHHNFVQYYLGVFTIPDAYKNYIITMYRNHTGSDGPVRAQLGQMKVKSLVELSRDVLRNQFKAVCTDARQFLHALDELKLPTRIKHIIQCKYPVNNCVYK